MSAFEIDTTRNLVIESNTILLPDKNKFKTFQLGDTADFPLNRAEEIHCQLFPKANLPQSWCSKIELVSSWGKIILFIFFLLTKHKSMWEVQRASQTAGFEEVKDDWKRSGRNQTPYTRHFIDFLVKQPGSQTFCPCHHSLLHERGHRAFASVLCTAFTAHLSCFHGIITDINLS